ncbi:MAG: metallopeptidase family protein [Gemmatimonadales bacterium]
MRLDDFQHMVRRLAGEVPADFLDGIAEVVVSARTVSHPARPGVYTLGECVPLPTGQAGEVDAVQSRLVLYYGSFAALAREEPGFDWRGEAWETLTHELRHHLEWRARRPDLEDFDWAVEQNFARQDGEPFDPAFHLEGEALGDGTYRVDDDVFLDRLVGAVPPAVELSWRGRAYRVSPPPDATLPAFLTIEGVARPPAGELVLVLRRAGLGALFRRRHLFQAVVQAERQPGYLPRSSRKGQTE